jgi:hypothetical protein
MSPDPFDASTLFSRGESGDATGFVCWYNFVMTSETIKKTPLLASELKDHLWTIDERTAANRG